MDETCDCFGWLIGYGPSLVDTYGQKVLDRALEMAKGLPPEANLMPFIYRALKEGSGSTVSEKP